MNIVNINGVFCPRMKMGFSTVMICLDLNWAMSIMIITL
jgi:hypothetical protein